MRTALGWLPVIALFGSVSCAFLLDFDELGAEAGDAGTDSSLGGAAGAGGTGGAGAGGGSGGASGSGGAGDAGDAGDSADAGPLACTTPGVSAECDDGDPCTTDVCVEHDAGPNVCFHAGKLFDDGQIDLPAHDYLGGLSVTGGAGRFYVSKYFGTKKPDAGPLAYDYETAVFEVPVAGSLQKGAERLLGSDLGAAPRGPVGLLYAGGKLMGFGAVEVGFLDWRVKQLEYPADLLSPPLAKDVCTGACYGATLDGTRRPVPYVAPNGQPSAMWIGPGGVWMGSAGAPPVKNSIPAGSVTAVAPVVSDSAVGALWRDDSEIRLTFPNAVSATVTSCYAKTGIFEGLAAAGRGRMWVGAFAHKPIGPVLTEFNSFYLTGGSWSEIETCKSADDPTLQGVSLPGLTSYQRPSGSSSERLHFAVAGVTAATGELWVNASYVELAPGQLEVVAVGGFEMDGPSTSKLSSSVDQPVVAYADDKLLVAWRDSNTLRLRRFKICQQ